MSYLNVAFDLANLATVIIPLDRWSYPAYSVQVETGGTVLVEGTNARVNRGETPVWATVNDQAGAGVAAQGVGVVGLENNPYEAISLPVTAPAAVSLMAS